MPSVFLSHTRIDKPFVEKLARDLQRLGVNVWFDKWEIKVGDSITWKIEQGLRENDYLAIVLSPEALQSEWVKSEISAAWVRQMLSRKVVVLPILYRDCNIPLFLADRRYADFMEDYETGLAHLADALGIDAGATMSRTNWRRFARKRTPGWQEFRDEEFRELVRVLLRRAREYNWSTWVGGSQTPHAMTLSTPTFAGRSVSVSVRIDGRTYAYRASLADEANPNHLAPSCFDIYVGNTINECEEFVWRRLEAYRHEFGDPPGRREDCLHRYVSKAKVREMTEGLFADLGRAMDWSK